MGNIYTLPAPGSRWFYGINFSAFGTGNYWFSSLQKWLVMRFDQYAKEANTFLKEVATELGTPEDTDLAYRIMVSVMHTIRQILTPEESIHFISQLPMYLKAEYVNGWSLKPKERIRSMETFLQCVRSNNERTASRDFGNDETAKMRIKALLTVIQRHISIGEIVHVLDQFPGELLELWGGVSATK